MKVSRYAREGISVYRSKLTPVGTDGMLLPPLCTQPEYVKLAIDAGLKVFHEPKDISKDVSKTWLVKLFERNFSPPTYEKLTLA